MRRIFIHLMLTCMLDMGLLLHSSSLLAKEPAVIAVIVSAEATHEVVKHLASEELSLIFWRKKRFWSDGSRIHPANLQAEHPLRSVFSETVLHSLPKDQINYWNGQYFHGIFPPHTLESEEAMIRYVADTAGAIGYINACSIDSRVKPVLWITHQNISGNPPDIICTQPKD